MTINVTDIESMKPEAKAELLCELVRGSYLWWFRDTLRSLNVPQRTRHYKAFSWSQSNHSDQFDTREERRLIACTQILDSTTISDWLNFYLQNWAISGFVKKLQKVLDREDIPVQITVN
tara:strand:+ start:123 stop:479 length:357 start_codon:yes stop_codon:yes gene_type:complete